MLLGMATLMVRPRLTFPVAVTWPLPIFEPLGQTLSDLAWLALTGSQRSFFGHVLPVKRSSLGRVMLSRGRAGRLTGAGARGLVDVDGQVDRVRLLLGASLLRSALSAQRGSSESRELPFRGY